MIKKVRFVIRTDRLGTELYPDAETLITEVKVILEGSHEAKENLKIYRTTGKFTTDFTGERFIKFYPGDRVPRELIASITETIKVDNLLNINTLSNYYDPWRKYKTGL